ncbi:MAG: hypothetical protein ACRDE9_00875 [Candidatus Limnocylindria bacterium]
MDDMLEFRKRARRQAGAWMALIVSPVILFVFTVKLGHWLYPRVTPPRSSQLTLGGRGVYSKRISTRDGRTRPAPISLD